MSIKNLVILTSVMSLLLSVSVLAESDDLRAKISYDVEVPDEIWEDKPVKAKCKYWLDLKGLSWKPKLSDPDAEYSFLVSVIFEVQSGDSLFEVSGESHKKKVCHPGRGTFSSFVGFKKYKNIVIDGDGRKTPLKNIEDEFVVEFFPNCVASTYKYSCRIVSDNHAIEETNKENNIDILKTPGIGGYEISQFQNIPVVTILKPFRKTYKTNPLTESLDIEGQFDPRNLSEKNWVYPETYTKVFQEKWNFKLEKKVRNVGKKFKTIKSYSGLLRNKDSYKPINFKTKIDKATLDIMDTGDYRLISWLSQENTPNGTIKGKTTTFDFKIIREGLNLKEKSLKPDVTSDNPNNIDSVNIPRNFKNGEIEKVSPSSKTDKTFKINQNISLQKDILFETNLFGMDYKHYKTDKWNDCNISCRNENKCKSWTWVEPGIKGPDGFCFLKNGVPEKRTDECCVSGIKN